MQTTKTDTGYALSNIEVDAKPYSLLPVQQARALLYATKGYPQRETAMFMGVKEGTVKKMWSELSLKLNTHNMRETIHQAIQSGILRYTLLVLLSVNAVSHQDHQRPDRTNRMTRVSRTKRANPLSDLQNKLLSA